MGTVGLNQSLQLFTRGSPNQPGVLYRKRCPVREQPPCARTVTGCRNSHRWSAKYRDATCSGAQTYGSTIPAELEWKVREAGLEDWWQVSELHCRGFYPAANCLTGVLLRFDRVKSLQSAVALNNQGLGRFACLAAFRTDGKPKALLEVSANGSERILRAATLRMPQFLKAFAARPVQDGFGISPEDTGMLGSVCIDSLGQFVPMRKRKGEMERRHGFAYLSNLSVDRTFRRRGIGRHLLNQAAEMARSWGCRAVLLQCDPRNAGARSMYVEAGFRHVGLENQALQFLEGRVGVRLELMCKAIRT